jgi:hypothetical protein
MKKLLPFGAIALGLLSLAAISHAQTQITSIQFTTMGNELDSDPTSGPGTAAGELSESYWNGVDLEGAYFVYNNPTYPTPPAAYTTSNDSDPGNLVDSTGTNVSPIGFSITGGGLAYHPTDTLSGGNGILLNNGLITYGASSAPAGQNYYGAPVTLTLSNLTASDVYSFYVYVDEPDVLTQGSVSVSSGLLTGATQYFVTAEGGYSASTTKTLESKTSPVDVGTLFANNAGGAFAAFASDYVEFTGITGMTSDTISLTELGSWPNGTYLTAGAAQGNEALGISGVQVVDVAGVPEPSSGWMVALGAVGLGAFLRRKCAVVV